MRGCVVILAVWAALAQAGAAQETPTTLPDVPPGAAADPAAGPLPSPQEQAPAPAGAAMAPLVVIDPERLFRESAFGRASAARIGAEQAALVAENRRLDGELEAEERALTDRRATLPPEEFRTLAAAFDQKAEGIRNAQAQKDRAIQESLQADRQRFLQVAAPELARLMADMGAVAMLDKQVIFLSFDAIDVTDRAIARIDAALGDGSAVPAP